MVRNTLYITLAVAMAATLLVPCGIAADKVADVAFDELTLLPRDTIAVVRIASPQRLTADLRQIMTTIDKQLLDFGIPELLASRSKQTMKESYENAGDLTALGVVRIGDLARTQYFGMVLLPQQSQGKTKQPQGEDAEQEKDANRIVVYGVLCASDAEAIQKQLTELDEERYKQEKKSYDSAKEKKEKLDDDWSAFPTPFSTSLPTPEPLVEPEKPKQFYCVSHESWVLYTSDERCLPLLQQAVADRKHSLAAVIGPMVRKTLMAGDFSGAVNMALVMNQAEAKETLAEMKQGLEVYVQMIDWTSVDWKQADLNVAQVKQYVQKFIDALFVMAHEPQWAAGYIDVTVDAIVGGGVVTVRKKGFIDQFLSSRPPIALDLLERLPVDKPFYLAFQDNQSLERMILSIGQRFAATVKEKREVRSLTRLLEAKPKQTAFAIDGPLRSDWGLRLLRLTEAKNPAAFLDYAANSSARVKGTKNITYEKGFEKFRGHDVDVKIEEVVDSNKNKESDSDNFADALISAISGTYRETWMYSQGKHFMSASGYTWDHAKKEFERLLRENDRSNRSEAFAVARRHIDKRANIVLLVSLPEVYLGCMKFISQQLSSEDTPPLERLTEIKQLERLTEITQQGPQSYTAGSIAFLPGEIRGRFYFPVKQYTVLEAIADLEDPVATGPFPNRPSRADPPEQIPADVDAPNKLQAPESGDAPQRKVPLKPYRNEGERF